MNKLSQLIRRDLFELPMRKKISGVNMQMRKEVRRMKKLNIYSREFTGLLIFMQDNRTSMDGLLQGDTKLLVSTWRQQEMRIQEHCPLSLNSRNKSVKSLLRTRIGSTTSSATISRKSSLSKRSKRIQ